MTGAPRHHPGTGWPFWAPSDEGAVAGALDLAGVGPGDRFVDLGCGDGRVLVAAGRRGAAVTGVESDPGLAEEARAALADAGVDGRVVEADIFEHRLDADVVFTYLSPATLQRLVPAFASLPAGARVVTVDFAVPGLVPAEVDGPNHLYVLPARRRPRRRRPGWGSAGALVVAVAGFESLTTLEPVHAGGAVSLTVRGPVADAASFRVGVERAEPRDPVAVDVRWGEHDAGTVAWGSLRLRGVRPFPFFVVFSDEDGGLWELSEEACERLRRHLARRAGPVTSTAAELLAVATGGG